jgi:hypothetical protein
MELKIAEYVLLKKNASNMQSNIITKHNQLYVENLIIVELGW